MAFPRAEFDESRFSNPRTNIVLHDGLKDLIQIVTSPHNKVMIVSNAVSEIETPVAIKGFLAGDVNFDGNATWASDRESGKSHPYNEKMSDMFQAVIKLAQYYMPNAMSDMIGSMGSDRTVQHVLDSISHYKGTQPFRLNLSLLFIALNEGYDVREPIRQLNACVYPSIQTRMTLRAPLGYIPGRMRSQLTNHLENVPGALAIQIGRWFKTPYVFVCDNFTAQVSRELIAGTQTPLLARVNVALRAAGMLSSQEINQFFVDPHENNVSGG